MDFSFKEDLFLATINLLWVILTYGWVSEIIFVCFLIAGLIIFISLLFKKNVIWWILKDKYSIAKSYLVLWTIGKIIFLKGYFYVIKFQFRYYNWRLWVIIIIALVVIVGSLVGVYFFFSSATEQSSNLINQSINI